MKILAQLVLLMIASAATAQQQQQSFEYSRLSDSTRQFKSETHHVIFGKYKWSLNNLKERGVSVNGDVYLFTVKETKAGLVQKIGDADGTTVATVFLGSNDIVSGTLNLKWNGVDSDNWAYLSNGKEVMHFSYQKIDGTQRVHMTYDSILPFPVQLAGLEKGLDHVRYHDYSGLEGKVQFGIKGGANVSGLSASINSDSEFKSGLNVGFYFKAPIGRNAFFRPEMLYSVQGQKDNYTYSTGVDAGKTTTTLSYLNIPLLLEFGKTITLQTGMQVGVLLSADEKGRIGTEPVDDDLKKFMSKVDMSFVVGMGANLTPRFNLGARYNLGLSDIFKNAYEPYPGLEFPSVKNRVFHFFVGYSL